MISVLACLSGNPSRQQHAATGAAWVLGTRGQPPPQQQGVHSCRPLEVAWPRPTSHLSARRCASTGSALQAGGQQRAGGCLDYMSAVPACVLTRPLAAIVAKKSIHAALIRHSQGDPPIREEKQATLKNNPPSTSMSLIWYLSMMGCSAAISSWRAAAAPTASFCAAGKAREGGAFVGSTRLQGTR